MALKYQALLTPICIRETILRNRMMSSASTPHFLQGTEPYPTEKVISHFAHRARNSAASVTINHFHRDSFPVMGRVIDHPPCHFNLFDLEDSTAQNYFCQLVDSIHFYGAKATGYLMGGPEWFASREPAFEDNPPPPPMPPMGAMAPASSETDVRHPRDDGPPSAPVETYTREMMSTYAKNAAREACDLVRLGFDIISLHASYRHAPHTKMLSPLTNHRTDAYGGNMENRSRFVLDVYREIRRQVGPKIPLEITMSVCEPDGGYTVEDTIEFCKLANGLIDIIHLRSGEADPQHPLGFTSSENMPTPYLDDMAKVTKAVHELGLDMVVGASSGFQDPEWANAAIADGKCDLVYMARAWINNRDYGKKVYAGRADDIVPCIRCNKCHIPNGKDMWRSVCSVNPEIGFEDKLDRMVSPADVKYKIAVIGGGPAGLEYARVAAQRGHTVTLYEANDRLGGQLCHADYPSFKWPLKQFKNFMAAQVEKLGVTVHLNTRATAELLSGKGYDVIAVAIGSTPILPPIPGADGDHVCFATNVYGNMEDRLGDELVMIGGGEIGVETALYLCELGKKVTVLEMLPELIMDAPHAHYKNMVHDYWCDQPNFRFQCGVRVTEIGKDSVTYTDHKNKNHTITCSNVLLATGARPLTEAAMEFAGVADRMIVIGDCDHVANVQHAMRTAYGAAMSL